MTRFMNINHVFVTYRREGGWETARLIREALTGRGYSVFLDVENLRAGRFNRQIYSEIEHSSDLIVILSPLSMDRVQAAEDWVRLEIAHAFKHDKNVIPVFMQGFDWPDAPLPEDIAEIRNCEGLPASHMFFSASIDRLCDLLTAKPVRRNHRLWAFIMGMIFVLAAATLIFVSSFGLKSRAKLEPLPTDGLPSVPKPKHVYDVIPPMKSNNE